MPSTWILGINNLDMGIFWACAPSAPMLIYAPFPRDWSQHQLGPMLHLKLSAIAKINAHEGRDGGGENAGNGVRKLLIQKRWNQGGKLMKQPVIDLELTPIDGDRCLEDMLSNTQKSRSARTQQFLRLLITPKRHHNRIFYVATTC